MVVTAVADEAAASIANNYGAPGREPFYSYIAPDDYSKADPYRYLNSKKLQNSVEKKGKWYASYSLAKDEWNTKKRTDFLNDFIGCFSIFAKRYVVLQKL